MGRLFVAVLLRCSLCVRGEGVPADGVCQLYLDDRCTGLNIAR